ncbi:CRISPR-associated endonuclease Cas2 [Streptococcus fryi]
MRLFNLTSEEREFARKQLVFCLVIYNIRSQKRRVQLSKLLESYGVRVQKSCFEMFLTPQRYHELIREISMFYTADEQDNIIVYKGKKDEVVAFNPYDGADVLAPVIVI